MDALRLAGLSLGILLLTGCQASYYLKSAYHQVKILNARVPVEQALKDPQLTEEQKEKIRISVDALYFAESQLGLTGKGNYTSYVDLHRDYVSWVVSAAESWQLKHRHFSYPIVGKMPYKGFFSEEEAQQEKLRLEKEELDVYLRGVSAYSTLGWFRDPILSSMLRYSEHDLVNTIIHETVHATLYIKNSADFNERLAVFIGNTGTELFYQQREGKDSPTLKTIAAENQADRLFSKFISQELKDLEEWYQALPVEDRKPEVKARRLKEIQIRFSENLKPKLTPGSFARFEKTELNNAYLMVFKTYMQDLSDFEKLYEMVGKDMRRFMDHVKTLEKVDNPEKGLKELILQLKEPAD